MIRPDDACSYNIAWNDRSIDWKYMKLTLCSKPVVAVCPNGGDYCRQHTIEFFKWMRADYPADWEWSHGT